MIFLILLSLLPFKVSRNKMNIFVVNSGSSSIKYQLFKMPAGKSVCSGLVERIGLGDSIITHRIYSDDKEKLVKKNLNLANHEEGLKEVAALLTDREIGVIKKPGEIDAVGHRVVHGGETFAATTIITKEVKEKIRRLFPLAPLHNPANYLGIEVSEIIFNNAKQVAVFDTAFHQTLPKKAYMYAIPGSLYSDHYIRAYGFHGTSHKYVSGKAMEYLRKPEAKLITIHLGNGCSMTAVKDGKSVDTSMGFSPLSGLVMGTRSGDIDPSIIFHLTSQLGYDPEQVNSMLNKQSGMLGLTGFSDMRDIGNSAQDGNKEAAFALELYAYRIKKYIGAYVAVLNGLDAIVFTAGVGENDVHTRQRICSEMQFLDIHMDEEKNKMSSTGIREINSETSPVKILVIPTNEELEIVQQCYELLSSKI
jgi:acetate kinase